MSIGAVLLALPSRHLDGTSIFVSISSAPPGETASLFIR